MTLDAGRRGQPVLPRVLRRCPSRSPAPDGRPVNAIRGFLDMSAALIERRRPTRWVACLDLDWRPAFRVALVPSYKAHRVAKDGGEEIPPALAPQIPPLLEVLGAFGLACRRRGRLRGRRRDRHAGAPRPGPGRDRQRRPRPARPRHRSGDDPLHRQGHRQAGGDGPGRGAGQVRRAGRALRRLRVLRGDPSDGLPGVAGRRREDRRRAGRPGSAASRRSSRPARVGDDGFPAGAAGKVRAARTTSPSPPPRCAAGWTCRSTSSTTRSTRTARRRRLDELAGALGVRNSVDRLQKAIAKTLG